MADDNTKEAHCDALIKAMLKKEFGGWQLESVLGHGANGVVFGCKKSGMDEKAVMKVSLNSTENGKDNSFAIECSVMEKVVDTRNMEDRTAHLVRKLNSGSITVNAGGKTYNPSFVVMEDLPGNPVPVVGALTGAEQTVKICDFGLQLLKALYDLHQIGYIHRDLKPENVGMYLDKMLVLYDLGMAHNIMTPQGKSRIPRSHVGMRGTDEWCSLAAETGREQGRVDDLWGWLYCMNEWVNCRSHFPQVWSCFEAQPNVRQLMKSSRFPARLVLNNCPTAFYKVQLYLRSLGVTDTPDYFYLASILNEGRRAVKRNQKQAGVTSEGLLKELRFMQNLYF